MVSRIIYQTCYLLLQADFEQELNKWVQSPPTNMTSHSTPANVHELEEAMHGLGPLEDVPSTQPRSQPRLSRAMSIQQGELEDIADKLSCKDTQ